MIYEIKGWDDGYSSLEHFVEDWMHVYRVPADEQEMIVIDDYGGGLFEIEYAYGMDEWFSNMMNTLQDDFPDVEVSWVA